MKRGKFTGLFSVFLALTLLLSMIPAWPAAAEEQPPDAAGEGGSTFTDVSESSWYYSSVEYVYSRGLMKGTSETTFDPGVSLTRAMLVTILYRMDGTDYEAEESAFTDVAEGKWYCNEVNWAAANGIVNGIGDNLFGPDNKITREQLALIMFRYAVGKEYSEPEEADLSSFTDASQIHAWAREAVEWAVSVKLISGKGDGILDPLGNATRAEVAAIIQRFYQRFVEPGGGAGSDDSDQDDDDDDTPSDPSQTKPEDYIIASSQMILDNPTETGTAAAAADDYFSRRLILKTDGTALNFADYHVSDYVVGPDNLFFLQFETTSAAKEAKTDLSNTSGVVYVEPDQYIGSTEDSERQDVSQTVLSGLPVSAGEKTSGLSVSPEALSVSTDPESSDVWTSGRLSPEALSVNAEQDYTALLLSDVSDSAATNRSWGAEETGANKYAEYLATLSAEPVTVAVIDTGVSKHTFLSGRLAADGYDLVDNDKDPADRNNHGTHVAGTIVDCTPGLGNIQIMSVRVLDSDGNGTELNVGNGIRYAVDHGADVINLSLCSPMRGKHLMYLEECVKYAVSKGVCVVQAAGNAGGDTQYFSPAGLSDAIVVGAIDKNYQRAYFSNFGSSLDIVAPGVDIYSCIPGGSYELMSGTSMAAPHVTAAAAMLLLERPSLTPAEIEDTLKEEASDLGDTGWDRYYGSGMLNLSNLTSDKYEVTFDANGGSIATDRKKVSAGSTYGDLPAATRTGYTFDGWYTAASGGTLITASSTVAITADQTLYAHWTASNYTVTFDANGGSVGSDRKQVTYAGTYGDLPVPTRSGYDFTGWYTTASGGTQITASSTVTITAGQTLYAHWTERQVVEYIVTFDPNGGSVSMDSKTVAVGETYGELPTPTRDGYGFDGWYTAADGGTKIVSSAIVEITADQTLYAYWSAGQSTVLFNANGGSVSTDSKAVTYGGIYGDLPTPERTGFTFAGWFTAASGGTQVTASSTVSITANQTLYAHWTAVAYTVSWSTGTGYTISVSRTSSPNVGASTGTLTSGSAVYYGDVLSVNYAAATGYSLSSQGAKSITVSGNVNSGTIYASASANKYTYNIVYKSSNGTSLGTATVTNTYGTSATVAPKSVSGYTSPASQTVKWDSTSAKTITFTYTPTSVGTTTVKNNAWWWKNSDTVGIKFTVKVAFSNRTANSVKATITWTNTITKNTWYGYWQKFNMTIGSVSTGDVSLATNSTWASSSTSARSVTKTATITVTGLSATQTSVKYSATGKAYSGAANPGTFSGTLTIPTY